MARTSPSYPKIDDVINNNVQDNFKVDNSLELDISLYSEHTLEVLDEIYQEIQSLGSGPRPVVGVDWTYDDFDLSLLEGEIEPEITNVQAEAKVAVTVTPKPSVENMESSDVDDDDIQILWEENVNVSGENDCSSGDELEITFEHIEDMKVKEEKDDNPIIDWEGPAEDFYDVPSPEPQLIQSFLE